MATNYDTHFQLLDPEEQQRTGKYFGYGFVASIAVRGSQKLINRWLKCLLTPKGSDSREPTYGTNFTALMGSNVASTKDALDAVTLFIDDCNNQMYTMDRARRPPDDERLDRATITRVEPHVSGSGFDIYVTIRNSAGLAMQFQLPDTARR